MSVRFELNHDSPPGARDRDETKSKYSLPRTCLVSSRPDGQPKLINDDAEMLEGVDKAEPNTPEQFLALVYEELRRLAAYKLASEAPGQTLQPTALVHEAWLRLIGDPERRFQNRTHFFRAAAEAMRRILIDRARYKQALRHGGEYSRVDLNGTEFELPGQESDDRLIAMNEALNKFAQKFPVQAELVKLRHFVGLTNEEAAVALDISVSTVKNFWNFSRAWLLNEIKKM